MDNIIEKVFDGFKKLTPALIAIMVFTGLILFLPISVLEKMALQNIPNPWRVVSGLVFLLCAAIVLSLIIFWIYKKMGEVIKKKRYINKKIKIVEGLSTEQKRILNDLLKSENKSIVLDKNSGNTIYLEQNRFIYQPQQIISFDYSNILYVRFVPETWLMDLYIKDSKIKKIIEK